MSPVLPLPTGGKKLYKGKKTVEKRQQFKQVQKRQSATWENTAHVESAPRNALKIRTAVKCVIWDAAKSSSDVKVRGSELLIKPKDEHKPKPIHGMRDGGEQYRAEKKKKKHIGCVNSVV